jgi:hypothetical protein
MTPTTALCRNERQNLRSARNSVTNILMSGRSNTWRFSNDSMGWLVRSMLHSGHVLSGRVSVMSGFSLWWRFVRGDRAVLQVCALCCSDAGSCCVWLAPSHRWRVAYFCWCYSFCAGIPTRRFGFLTWWFALQARQWSCRQPPQLHRLHLRQGRAARMMGTGVSLDLSLLSIKLCSVRLFQLS